MQSLPISVNKFFFFLTTFWFLGIKHLPLHVLKVFFKGVFVEVVLIAIDHFEFC